MVGLVLLANEGGMHGSFAVSPLTASTSLLWRAPHTATIQRGAADSSPFHSQRISEPSELQLEVSRRHPWLKADGAKAEGKRSGVDRDTKEIKRRLQILHTEIKNAERCFTHIHWLQERFPSAKYEDVTGLCKLAGQADLEEQDYSLNPGRYVGVVIEEDGKTEEEFIEDLSAMQTELQSLDDEAKTLASVIAGNVNQLTGDS